MEKRNQSNKLLFSSNSSHSVVHTQRASSCADPPLPFFSGVFVCKLAFICATGQNLLNFLELFPFFFFFSLSFFSHPQTSLHVLTIAPMLHNVTHINSDVLRQQDQLLGQILRPNHNVFSKKKKTSQINRGRGEE
jgi:hypothetical protein